MSGLSEGVLINEGLLEFILFFFFCEVCFVSNIPAVIGF